MRNHRFYLEPHRPFLGASLCLEQWDLWAFPDLRLVLGPGCMEHGREAT